MNTSVRHRPGFFADSPARIVNRVGGFYMEAAVKSDPYIAFRKVLVKDGRVRILSEKLRTNVREIVGALVHLWILADDYADKKGVLFGWKPTDIDAEIGLEGFTDALPADWFATKNGWAQLPQYQQHNGSTAKTRIADARRKRASRSCPETVRKLSGQNGPRGEERRGKDIKDITDRNFDLLNPDGGPKK